MTTNWNTTTLADAKRFELLNGLWKGKKPPFQEAVVIRNTNFRSDGVLDLSDAAVLQVESRQLENRTLRPGDIIIERSGGGPKQPVGRVCYFDCNGSLPYSFSNFTSTLRIRDRKVFLPRFVHYWLLHLYHDGFTVPLQRATTGIRNLDFDAYLNAEIPEAPFNQQEQISAVLWKLQRAIEVGEKLIATMRELKQSAMRQLFTCGLRQERQKETDFGALPESWQTQLLGECCVVQTGVTKGRKFAPDEALEVPYLRVANVQDGRLDLREIKTITIRRHELNGYLLRDGDVVLTEGGDFDKLGRGFIWRGEIPNCVHQNHIFAVRAKQAILSPEFLAYVVQSPYGRSYFLTVAHKTTNLACINATKLKAFPVPFPSLKEQREIACILQAIDRKISVLERRRSTLQELFRTLLHDLMTDQIRIGDLDIDSSDMQQ